MMDKVLQFFKKFISKLPVIGFDFLAIPTACLLSLLTQSNIKDILHRTVTKQEITALATLCCVQLCSYYYFRVYRGLWRFASLNDVLRIVRSVMLSVCVIYPLFHLLAFNHLVSNAFYPLYAVFLIAQLCSARLICRHYLSDRNKNEASSLSKKVLIIGAGQAGESLIRDLRRDPAYTPVGVLDDNRSKQGLEVHGVRVLGMINKLPSLVTQLRADLIFIAIPSAGSIEMRRIVKYCESANIPFHTLPSLHALVSGRVEVNVLRKVNIEDLLGRDQVNLSWDKIAERIQGRRVLVTGAGGSIGSELCRQIIALKPEKILLLDNNEFNLYQIEQELSLKFPDIEKVSVLVSIVDGVAVQEVFRQFLPHLVFHAAAYKHVPMLEEQIRVAVRNNVIGTQVVAEASVAVDVEAFILISTDKAVNPFNVMGATKRVAEIYCQNLNARVKTQFITVRFGNVLGSVGSVVPFFQKQLEAGGPLTVTHPDIQRYFMTIPEASQLILQALAIGHGGEILVLDMGEPIKITYLAEQMIRLAGKEPGVDIEIQYIGLRPGEKLYEELFHASEALVKTDHAKLFKARFREIDWNELTQTLRMMNSACSMHQQAELLILLKSLVPEFHHEERVKIPV